MSGERRSATGTGSDRREGPDWNLGGRDDTDDERRDVRAPRPIGLNAAKATRDEQDSVVVVGVVVQPSDPRLVGWAGIRRRQQRQHRQNEDETNDATGNHGFEDISREPRAARRYRITRRLRREAASDRRPARFPSSVERYSGAPGTSRKSRAGPAASPRR